jgi:hypothetical protein
MKEETKMTRNVFLSYYYKPDHWRASQVRNIEVIEGNSPVSDNEWQSITKRGDQAIKNWIEAQLSVSSCTIVLAGSDTANRKWINYEIMESWKLGKGVAGICIHNLLDKSGSRSPKGINPFSYLMMDDKRLSTVVKLYDPPYRSSTDVLSYIQNSISDIVEEAIKIRSKYP